MMFHVEHLSSARTRYDVVVVGGGHAGCEAACAATRRGARTLLVTSDPACIGEMSCNPAIGGVGKGHLVREVDVFDGLMARAADHAGIHYRMLNASKGGAVRGPRVQADRKRYRAAIQATIAGQHGCAVMTGHVDRLRVVGGSVAGLLLTEGTIIDAATVVLATGTFLGGRIFRGHQREDGGRIGEAAATILAAQLRDLGLPVGRLKTGTPPRLDGRTIDWAKVAMQASDREGWSMSPLGPGRVAPQLACGVVRTNTETHAIIQAGLHASPLRSGAIVGTGPRYCPSIEDKIVRFADRDGHQLFLEPEGLDTSLIYPNGISTSLPVETQRVMVRSIGGLEAAEIVQPGYAVEYDYLDPRSLDRGLQSRHIAGLFMAGQINGTTGYEEAAAQGLVAGLNAAARAADDEPILFDRAQSYIGVMVDDLTLQGVTEPYRMLTSRAEHRLRLRADNAPTRLGALARKAGAICPARQKWLNDRDELRARMEPGAASRGSSRLEVEVAGELADDAHYAPYIARQEAELARLRADEGVSLARITTYCTVPGLSSEMIERLEACRPETLSAAGRVRGVTPAALAAIALAVRRRAA